MTDEEIHNVYLHMSGKAEGLVEATGKADFPVLFARAILEYEGMTKDVQNMASESTYKEQVETKEYERGFIDGMRKQMQSSVDKAVNAMGNTRPWYTIDELNAWADNYQNEQWHKAAIRLGEELASVGPVGYYEMDAKEWLDWALNQLKEKNT